MARIETVNTLEEAKIKWPKYSLGFAEDLTGKRFGQLVLLYRTQYKPKQTHWVCKCDCGKYKMCQLQGMKNGTIISCGCNNTQKARERMLKYNLEQQKIIENGTRFGKLTVINYLGFKKQKSRNKNASYYLCQCDCGSAPIEVMGNSLITGGTTSCGCIKSRGESIIKYFLDKQNIKYKTEYCFDDLINPKTNAKLRFDFAIFENKQIKYLIEFDGRQHYTGPEADWTQSANLKEIQYKDTLKNKYCLKNHIPLIRIPYWHLSNLCIENLLLETSNFLVKE